MKRLLSASIAAAFLLVAGTAMAKPAKKKPAATGYTKPVKSYDIKGDDVGGKHLGPTGDQASGDKEHKQPSLIRKPTDFNRKIVKSAEDM